MLTISYSVLSIPHKTYIDFETAIFTKKFANDNIDKVFWIVLLYVYIIVSFYVFYLGILI
jgi:hypothetical protein